MRHRKTRLITTILLNLLLLLAVGGCAAAPPVVSLLPTATPLSAFTPPAASQTPPPTATSPPSPTPVPTKTSPAPSPTPTSVPTPKPAPVEATEVAGCVCGEATCPCQINHVVIISIDGLRPDAIEEADTPTLDALRAQGAYSPAAQAVLPSVTLVNHASMLGGMSPAKHGIYWNTNDPDLGKVKGPTLFSLAHEAGLSTAMVVGKPKLKHLVLPDSVDNYIYAGFTDLQ
ncbi:MAG TPA: alkaline phosphatase family protein, partial [Anaerolineae bacterium]|nr:alkaline phosphatase family protein [Anaerolineae bacterium]